MKKSFLAFFATTALFASSWTQAATINFLATPLGGSSWQYDYTVTNDSLTVAIDEFTIFFTPNLYANLVAGTTAGWDILAIQPDAGIPADGFFDALIAGVAGIAPNDSASGFSVNFDFLGTGTPGSQPFDIVDPQTFDSLFSGRTVSDEVPTPGTLALLLVAGACAMLWNRARKSNHQVVIQHY